ncbi:MAG: OstA family protein [Segetibacter sp.]|nr:OstA family protein [Segetibacter sp.]
MITNLLLKTSFLSLFIIVAICAKSQVAIGDTSTGKKLEIIKADRYNFQKIEGQGDFISLAGNVKVKQDLTYFYCDSAVLNQAANTIEAFGNIHINDADSVHTYSQYLKYLGKEKTAFLKKKVRLTDSKAILTTDELEYNTSTRIGTYLKGGKVVNGKTVLTSTEGYYYGETRDIYFKKKVFLNDPEYKVTTDTLLYNTYTELARFTVPTKIVTGQRTVRTSEGYYDLKNKKAVFGKRPVVDDKDYTLTADDLAFDDASQFGEAQGNVVYKNKDTANAYAILANNVKSNNKTGAILATQKPLMIIKQDRDSIYVTADTLYSGKLSELEKQRFVPDISENPETAKTTTTTPADSNNSLESTDTSLSAKPANPGKQRIFENLTSTGSSSSNMVDSTSNRMATGDNLFLPNSPSVQKPGFVPGTPGTANTGKTNSTTPADSIRNRLASIDTVNSRKYPRTQNPKSGLANATTKKTNATNQADSNSNRFFEAYYNVKIFSDSLQAVGDSLFYSFRDSAFRLFKNPIVWAQDNQIVGDTIYLYTHNKKPQRFYAFENALAINQAEKDLYNQVKGNTINGIFKNGSIDFIRAKGSAENIYYTADEQGGFIGVNRSTSDVIDVTFQERKPYRVVFRNNLQGTISPIRQVNLTELRVRGFKWYDDKRPKTKFDLLGK